MKTKQEVEHIEFWVEHAAYGKSKETRWFRTQEELLAWVKSLECGSIIMDYMPKHSSRYGCELDWRIRIYDDYVE